MKKQKISKTGRVKNWVRMHRLLSMIAVLVVIGFGVFGYNNYLDWQNVNDMEELLASFEQLKTDVETETGEQFYIETDCGSVGKFSTSYSCLVSLKPADGTWNQSITSSVSNNLIGFLKNTDGCAMLSMNSTGFQPEEERFVCSGFHVRGNNEAKSEEIFFEYDTSPGSSV